MDLTITVTTRDGRTASTAVELPRPAEAGMRVGLSTAVEHYDLWHPLFPGFGAARLFWQPGDGLPDWTSPKLTRLPSGVEPWLSFKDFPTDEEFVDILRGADRPAKVSWWHERDNNTPQSHTARMDFFARQRHLSDIVADVASPLVEWMSPPQTLQWTAGKSSLAKVKGDGDWRLWWPGSGAGSCWDCYVDSWASGYPDVEKFFAIPVEAAEGTGRDLYIAELGSIRLPNDQTGAGRE
jgi:hypothetical protein